MNVAVTFSRYRDEVNGPTLGPFPWVQFTYRELRAGPEGEPIAFFGADGDWHLQDTPLEPWSDVVVSPTSET